MLERNAVIIKKKLYQYLLPGILLTASLQVGNIVDTMLVGNILGPNAMSAVKIGMAVDNIAEMPGYVLGVGGSVAAGIFLGNREVEKARKVFSATLVTSVICGILFSIASMGADCYAEWLCGGSSLVRDARDFIFVALLLAPLLNVALQMVSYVAVDSHPTLVSAYVIVSNVINLVLDYVLLKYTALGTAGAALSTNLGYGIALLMLILYAKSPKRILAFVNPLPDIKFYLRTAMKAGIPTLLFMIFLTIKDISLNTIIITWLGETAMIIYAVCANIELCVQLFVGGIMGIFSTMGSVLYGEKDFFGIKSLIRYLLCYSYVILLGIMLVLMGTPESFFEIFGIGDTGVVAVGAAALCIYSLSLPIYLWNHFMAVYYQSTDKPLLASLVTSLQTCVAIVPLAYLFILGAKYLGMDSLHAMMVSFVLSEIVTLLVTFLYQRRKYKGENYFMLPARKKGVREFTVCKNAGQIQETVREIFDFCAKNEISSKAAGHMGLVAEEMLYNIFMYGGKNATTVDVFLHVSEEDLNMRLTDNGIPFNPLEYQQEETEFQVHGIEVMKKIAKRIEYLRVIDLNHTMIAIGKNI